MNHLQIVFVEQEADLEACLDIRKTVFTVEKGVSRDIEMDGFDRLGPDCGHVLIRYRQKPVGAARCLHTGKDTVRLQRFCFLREYRASGLGRAALEQIERHYQERGIAAMELDAKFEVQGFYEKCGYQRTSDVFLEAGIAHVAMRKLLIPPS